LTTKNYLFASVTSTLLLGLVVPLLIGPWWIPSELSSIVALSVLSIAVGGLTAETYVIARGRKAAPLSWTNARKYFICLISSSLFLAIVAPSIRPALDSTGVVASATVTVLFVLSLALAGLTSQGFFALIAWAVRENVQNKPKTSVPSFSNSLGSPAHPEPNLGSTAELDSRFKAFDSALDTRVIELKQELLGAIHDICRTISPDPGTNANVTSAGAPSLVQSEPVQRDRQTAPAKDHVVEALLGKAKAGAN
jgi:hypothetical protein